MILSLKGDCSGIIKYRRRCWGNQTGFKLLRVGPDLERDHLRSPFFPPCRRSRPPPNVSLHLNIKTITIGALLPHNPRFVTLTASLALPLSFDTNYLIYLFFFLRLVVFQQSCIICPLSINCTVNFSTAEIKLQPSRVAAVDIPQTCDA